MTGSRGETILEELLAADIDAFWDERESLAHVRVFARARMCSPWAVLGVVLARVAAAVPPVYLLPPLVGSAASLNLFVALTGPSGAGKGSAEGAARDALDVGWVELATVGSGEGIAHLYAHRERDEVVRDRTAVLFTVPEVDNLVALGTRRGATLLPQLRMAWSGERLGFSYADRTKTLPIERHTYRLSLVLGVQPGRAGPLLDDADAGTPQRFVWLPTFDPDVPDVVPPCPPSRTWRNPFRSDRGPLAQGLFAPSEQYIDVPDVARDTILANRRDQLRGEGVALEGHALLARLKLAAALAFLDERPDIDSDDWRLAGTVMAVSDRTRDDVVRELHSQAAERNRARGEAEADRAVRVDERLVDAQVHRVARSIQALLAKYESDRDGWVRRRDVTHSLHSRDRGAADAAFDALIDAGQVERDDAEWPSYRLVRGRR